MLKRLLLGALLMTLGLASPASLAAAAERTPSGIIDPAMVVRVTDWLAANFNLRTAVPPRFALVSTSEIVAIRYRDSARPQAAASGTHAGSSESTVVAVYDDRTGTIYLPEGWRGETPTEQSILVHELVHHLQDRLRLSYRCPQERERLAYMAQERWLGLHDLSLRSEFGIDAFTLLLHTKCMH